MEIAPVASVRLPSAPRSRPASATELTPVFDIENFARIGDETYTPGGGQSAGGNEDAFDDLLEDFEADSDPGPDLPSYEDSAPYGNGRSAKASTAQHAPARGITFVA